MTSLIRSCWIRSQIYRRVGLYFSRLWYVCCASSLSRVWLFATPWAVARQAPLSMGIFWARILGWVAMLSSSRSSQPRDWIRSSLLQVDSSPSEPPGKPKNTGVGGLPLAPGDLPNPGIEPESPASQSDSLPAKLPGKHKLIASR